MQKYPNDLVMPFDKPLYQDSEALVVKKTDKKQYTTWEDLRGEVIVACGGAANAAQRIATS